MTVKALHPNAKAELSGWTAAVTSLLDQIASWATAENWSVHRGQTMLSEEGTGSYEIPTLRVRTPVSRNELFVTPVGLRILGANGRVDIEAWPSLNRVMLIREGDAWRIVTDSNVELDQAWGRETFVALVRDLLAAVP